MIKTATIIPGTLTLFGAIGLIVSIASLMGCESQPISPQTPLQNSITSSTLIVLGNVQDAGSPQIGCQKDCCKNLWNHPDPARNVVSLGLIDPENGKTFLIEATPDFPSQWEFLRQKCQPPIPTQPDAILLTHAHIGHYSGLMYLGREAMGAKSVPVFAMPRMQQFLTQNGPWSQLVNLGNIVTQPLRADSLFRLSPNFTITPFLVPHRDEFSETVGYLIAGPHKKALFIPDIDKWEKWEDPIENWLSQVDYAFLDATFYDAAEINHRDISEIPHPFVSESMVRFQSLPKAEKAKIHFIHFNHTNPLLNPASEASQTTSKAGFGIARIGDEFPL